MKRQLMAYAAIAAFTLPILTPLSALAQQRDRRDPGDVAQAPQRNRGGPSAAQAPESPRSDPRPARQETRSAPAPERARERLQRSNDDGQGRGNSPQDRANRASGGVDRERARQNAPSRPDRSDRDRNRNDDRRGDRNQTHDERVQERANRASGGVDRANGQYTRPDRPNRPDNGHNRPDRPNTGGNNNGHNRPGNWDRNRDRSRQEYRNRFDSNRWQRDWNRNQRSDWWRSDRRFRSWSGVRIGFYFAPGYGYYNVPRQYYGQQFYEGQYLPSIFWRYQMNDYRTYGLGYPPEGTRWVYVDSTIYLIDEYDGFIIDVVRNFWRW